jgi:hypothetical protein
MKSTTAILATLLALPALAPVSRAAEDAALKVSDWTVLAVSFDDETNPAADAGRARRDMELVDGTWIEGASGKGFAPKPDATGIISAPDLGTSSATGEFYPNHFSLDFWVKPGPPAYQFLATGMGSDVQRPELPERPFFFVRSEQNGSLTFGVSVEGNEFIEARTAPFALTEDEWQHVVVSFNNKTAVILLDGEEVARSPELATPISGIILRPVTLLLGTNWDKKPEEKFTGAFDEVLLERRPSPAHK